MQKCGKAPIIVYKIQKNLKNEKYWAANLLTINLKSTINLDIILEENNGQELIQDRNKWKQVDVAKLMYLNGQ